MSGIMASMVQAATSAPPPGATWSPTYKGSNIALSGGNLIATRTGGAGYETVLGTGALSGVGSFNVLTDALGTQELVGVGNTGVSLTTFIGNTVGGIGWYTSGNVFINTFINSAPAWTPGDILNIYYDIPGAQVRFGANGGAPGAWWDISGITGPIYPGGSMSNVGASITGVF